MQLSDLLGLRVVDAEHHPVGAVVDVRLRLVGNGKDGSRSPELTGLVISPRTRSSYLGYERTGVNAPAAIALIAKWRHRGTFVAAWDDVARVGSSEITLRAGYRRGSIAIRCGRTQTGLAGAETR